MKNHPVAEKQTMRHILSVIGIAAFAVALPWPAYAREGVVPPPVPANVAVDASANVAFLVGHAFGTQNYVCLPAGSGVAFALFTPEATLLDEDGDQIITHFFGPDQDPADPNTNPAVTATGAIRAAWQHSNDGSTVWGKVNAGDSSTDPAFVAPNSIAWLKVTKAGVERGTTGGDKLTKTTFIQRLNTHGGVAPSTGCLSTADIGHLAFVPYTSDYFFYKAR
jgi:hypothetical protein